MSENVGYPKGSISSYIYRIPPRTRIVVVIAVLLGATFLIMSNFFITPGEGRAALDRLAQVSVLEKIVHLSGIENIVHFLGFMIFAFIFTLVTRVGAWVPVWLCLLGLGFGLTYLNTYVFDMSQLKNKALDLSLSMAFTAKAFGVYTGAFFGALNRMFLHFLRTEISDFLERSNTLNFNHGDIIFKQGDSSDYVYVIRHGTVRISRESEEGTKILGDVPVGDVFGEMGVIQNAPRYASATAEGECCLYRISEEKLLSGGEGNGEHPAVLVAQTLAKRVSELNKKLDIKTGPITPPSEDERSVL